MTHRPPHTLMYEGHEYELLGDYTGQLPMFDLLGISPKGFSTAGSFWPKYEIVKTWLYLVSITMWHGYETEEELASLPTINGIRPIGNEVLLAYNEINLLLPLTGQIVIGRELASEYMPPSRNLTDYIIILRLTLKDGEIKVVEDVSKQVATIRTKIDEIRAEAPKELLARLKYREDERKELDKQLNELTGGKRRQW